MIAGLLQGLRQGDEGRGQRLLSDDLLFLDNAMLDTVAPGVESGEEGGHRRHRPGGGGVAGVKYAAAIGQAVQKGGSGTMVSITGKMVRAKRIDADQDNIRRPRIHPLPAAEDSQTD